MTRRGNRNQFKFATKRAKYAMRSNLRYIDIINFIIETARKTAHDREVAADRAVRQELVARGYRNLRNQYDGDIFDYIRRFGGRGNPPPSEGPIRGNAFNTLMKNSVRVKYLIGDNQVKNVYLDQFDHNRVAGKTGMYYSFTRKPIRDLAPDDGNLLKIGYFRGTLDEKDISEPLNLGNASDGYLNNAIYNTAIFNEQFKNNSDKIDGQRLSVFARKMQLSDVNPEEIRRSVFMLKRGDGGVYPDGLIILPETPMNAFVDVVGQLSNRDRLEFKKRLTNDDKINIEGMDGDFLVNGMNKELLKESIDDRGKFDRQKFENYSLTVFAQSGLSDVSGEMNANKIKDFIVALEQMDDETQREFNAEIKAIAPKKFYSFDRLEGGEKKLGTIQIEDGPNRTLKYLGKGERRTIRLDSGDGIKIVNTVLEFQNRMAQNTLENAGFTTEVQNKIAGMIQQEDELREKAEKEEKQREYEREQRELEAQKSPKQKGKEIDINATEVDSDNEQEDFMNEVNKAASEPHYGSANESYQEQQSSSVWGSLFGGISNMASSFVDYGQDEDEDGEEKKKKED